MSPVSHVTHIAIAKGKENVYSDIDYRIYGNVFKYFYLSFIFLFYVIHVSGSNTVQPKRKKTLFSPSSQSLIFILFF